MRARLTIWVVASLTLLAACDCGGSKIDRICPTSCYDGPHGTAGIGACRPGIPLCDGDRKLVACLGEILPRKRSCNDIEDVACDHFKSQSQDLEIGTECGIEMGACHKGTVQCIDHSLQCAGGVQPMVQDDCSGRDVDCDGIPNNPPPRICYDGDPTDLTIPGSACRAGIMTCPAGLCQGEVLPHELRPVDIVVLMIRDREVIGNEVVLLGGYPWTEWRFGLGTAAKTNHAPAFRYGFYTIGASSDYSTNLATIPLMDGDSFALKIETLLSGAYPEEDVSTNVYDIATNVMGWPFRVGSRRIILLFADDNDEDYETSLLPTAHTAAQALQAMLDHGFELYNFSRSTESDAYALWVEGTHGANIGPVLTASVVTQDLSMILGPKSGCLP